MSRLAWILTGLAAGASITFLVVRDGTAQERREEVVSFDGQFLSVAKKSNPASSVDLEKAQLRTLGGKPFLVGVGADTPDNWQKGRVVWVALDDISEWTAFATLEELRKAGVPQEKKE